MLNIDGKKAVQKFDSTTDFFDQLPTDPLVFLLEKLHLHNLLILRDVSKKFREIIDTDGKLVNYIKIATVFLRSLKSILFRVSHDKSISEIYQPSIHKELVKVIHSLCRPYRDKSDLRKQVVLSKLIEDFAHICPECIADIAKSWEKDGKIFNKGTNFCDIIILITKKIALTDFKKATEFYDQFGISEGSLFFESPLQINFSATCEISENQINTKIEHQKITLVFYKSFCGMLKKDDDKVLQLYQKIQHKELIDSINLCKDYIDSFFYQILEKEALLDTSKNTNDCAYKCFASLLDEVIHQKGGYKVSKAEKNFKRTIFTTEYKNNLKTTEQSEYNYKTSIYYNLTHKMKDSVIDNTNKKMRPIGKEKQFTMPKIPKLPEKLELWVRQIS